MLTALLWVLIIKFNSALHLGSNILSQVQTKAFELVFAGVILRARL